MLIDFITPKGYHPLINTISLQNHAYATPLKPQIVMELILEEFNCLQIEESQSKVTENAMLAKGGKGKGKKPWKGDGLTSGGATNLDVECWTCGEKGHYKDKCPKKPKKKSGRNRGRSQEAHTSQAQDDYAFSSHLAGEALVRTTVDSAISSTTIYDSGATQQEQVRQL